MDAAKLAELEAKRKDRRAWVELGAAQEREELLDELRTWAVSGVTRVIALLEKRQREAGVQVHRCTAGSMEPDGEEVPPEQT